MHESPEDIARLQALLDDSYGHAGAHLASIHTPEARLTADDLVAALQGMQIFVVATTTQDGAPRTGPVDSFLYRGEVRFGTSAGAVRARHLARSPAVSATHVRGEALVVTAHGTARLLDLDGADSDFRGFLQGHYGGTYDQFLAGSPYYGIQATWLFAADMSVHTQGSGDGG
ncbi:MAG TPA: pyridoxamine 5'-phosphate oxidase family protein [Euzebya sp.]|nr:pyridoxamine 5'-phosphate oxidase family protein [Euzebya sp.]